VVGLVALFLAAGCGGSSDPAPSAPAPTTTTITATTTSALSYPTAAQRAELEQAIAAIYPGVPDGKAGDWAGDVCSRSTVEGISGQQLLDYVQAKFAGGTRPDPTPEQATEILAEIEASGCPLEGLDKQKGD
jgi:hypothetical protein